MKLPFFTFDFKFHIPRRWMKNGSRVFSIGGDNTILTGVIITAHLCGKPIFNLVADKGCECASPRKFPHEWFGGRVRWGFLENFGWGRSIITSVLNTSLYNQRLEEIMRDSMKTYRMAYGPDWRSN
jgi:hypothetical protein